MANPLDAIEDKAEEDKILGDANVDVYSEASEGELEANYQCFSP